jgi:hypothetical protein
VVDKLKIADTVKVDLSDSSAYRVAFDLAHQILEDELKNVDGTRAKAQADPRAYWLDLYAQCRSVVVDGHTAKYAKQKHSEG